MGNRLEGGSAEVPGNAEPWSPLAPPEVYELWRAGKTPHRGG